jgi:uncharacterized protein YbaP (TraB family)
MKRILTLITLSLLGNLGFAAQGVSTEQFEEQLGITFSEEYKKQIAPSLKIYNRGKSPKSIAVAVGADSRTSIGLATGAVSDLAASIAATQQCNKVRAELSIAAACEIVALGDVIVPLGFMLRRGISDSSPSLVWEVTSDRGRIFLAGSIHILKATLFPLAPAYERAFKEADQLAFEINPLLQSDPERVLALESLTAADPKEVKQALGKQVNRKLKKFVRSQGGKVSASYRLKPSITALQISQIKAGAYGYVSDLGLEMHFARQASTRGKPLLELESPIDALMILTELPMPTQVNMLGLTLDSLDVSHQLLFEMVSAWLHGDAEKLYELTIAETRSYPELANFYVKLLDDRNTQWMEKLETYLNSDKTTFVMVGAAHMAGKNGLLQQLRDAGYRPIRLTRAGQPVSAQPQVREAIEEKEMK